jgi:hypothetical protein
VSKPIFYEDFMHNILNSITYYFKPDKIRNMHIGDKVMTPDGIGLIYAFENDDVVLIEWKENDECVAEYNMHEIKRL